MNETAVAVIAIVISVGSIAVTALSVYLDWRWS